MQYNDYLNINTPESLEAMRAFAAREYIPIVKPDAQRLLSIAVTLKKPKTILEIGTAIGYSGLIMLKACPQATLVTIEKDEHFFDMAYENFRRFACGKKIIQKMGDAIDVLPELTGSFDFIFLDGAKAQYIKYLPYLLELLQPGGVLFADDVLFMGMVQGKNPTPAKHRSIVKNLQRFNQEVANNPQLTTALLDVEDGVSISVKKRS